MRARPGHLPQRGRREEEALAAIVNGGTEIVAAVRHMREIEAVELALVQEFETGRPVLDEAVGDREAEIDVGLFLPTEYGGVVVTREEAVLRRVGEIEGDRQQIVHEVLLQNDLVFQLEEILADRRLRVERKP